MIRTIIIICAFVLSTLSFLFTRRSWIESNRPIVTVEIKTRDGGNQAIVFDILVHNTGSRPAADVQLKADEEYIRKLLSTKCPKEIEKEIHNIFSHEGEIPLLHDGKSVRNGFGDASSLNYGIKIPIIITYRGLSGKKFKTRQNLIIKDTKYFAGSGWS